MTQRIAFVTGNPRKVEEAAAVLSGYGIEVEQLTLAIDEIQHHDPRKITEAKARAAYQAARRPVVVADSSWDIPALGGFPGGYMKDIVAWFRPEDFLALMRDKADRRVILHEVVAYCDGGEVSCFVLHQAGKFVDSPRGDGDNSLNAVVSMHGSQGLTIAEAFDKRDKENTVPRGNYGHWHQLGQWLAARR